MQVMVLFGRGRGRKGLQGPLTFFFCVAGVEGGGKIAGAILHCSNLAIFFRDGRLTKLFLHLCTLSKFCLESTVPHCVLQAAAQSCFPACLVMEIYDASLHACMREPASLFAGIEGSGESEKAEAHAIWWAHTTVSGSAEVKDICQVDEAFCTCTCDSHRYNLAGCSSVLVLHLIPLKSRHSRPSCRARAPPLRFVASQSSVERA